MFLGIDWGGTYIKIGFIDNYGRVISHKTISSPQFRGKDAFITQIEKLALSRRAGTIKAIGIAVPGIINVGEGFIYYFPNIAGWENYPLKDVLQKRLGIPVFIDNDANVFALAEARLGAARNISRAIFLTLGTGLGGAVLFNGEILEGAVSAVELGHMPIALSGQRCNCGGRGCIETFVGNKYLVQRYCRLKKRKIPDITVKDIFAKALRGEKEALKIWQDFSYALGMFLSGMINIFNPQRIIFGGGVSGAFRFFKPLLWRVIKEQAMVPQRKCIKLVRATLKNPGIIGAALLAQEALRKG